MSTDSCLCFVCFVCVYEIYIYIYIYMLMKLKTFIYYKTISLHVKLIIKTQNDIVHEIEMSESLANFLQICFVYCIVVKYSHGIWCNL